MNRFGRRRPQNEFLKASPRRLMIDLDFGSSPCRLPKHGKLMVGDFRSRPRRADHFAAGAFAEARLEGFLKVNRASPEINAPSMILICLGSAQDCAPILRTAVSNHATALGTAVPSRRRTARPRRTIVRG